MIYNSEDNKVNMNMNKSTNFNTITSKDGVEQLKNITRVGGKEEIEDSKNMTKYPLFSISSRSMKIGRNHRLKIVHRNEDYGRDCFDDLKDEMGSQGKV